MEVHEKSVVVNAPVHDVFLMWSNWESFPKYMSHVKNVKKYGDDMSHWEGSVAGLDQEWDAKTTEYVEDKVIGWESVNGLQNKGEIRFDDLGGRTALTVHIEYEPPAGVAGKAAETIYVGSAMDKSLEQDLTRFKSQAEIEEGD